MSTVQVNQSWTECPKSSAVFFGVYEASARLDVLLYPSNKLLGLLQAQSDQWLFNKYDIWLEQYRAYDLYNFGCLGVELWGEVLLNIMKVPLCQYFIDIVLGDGKFGEQWWNTQIVSDCFMLEQSPSTKDERFALPVELQRFSGLDQPRKLA